MLRTEFSLNEKEEKKAENFIKNQIEKDYSQGTVYDRFVYKFNPTSIGTILTLKDSLLE